MLMMLMMFNYVHVHLVHDFFVCKFSRILKYFILNFDKKFQIILAKLHGW